MRDTKPHRVLATRLLAEGTAFTIWLSPDRRRWYADAVGPGDVERAEVGTRADTHDDFDEWLWEYPQSLRSGENCRFVRELMHERQPQLAAVCERMVRES